MCSTERISSGSANPHDLPIHQDISFITVDEAVLNAVGEGATHRIVKRCWFNQFSCALLENV